MIQEIVVINDKTDLEANLKARNLSWKPYWNNYVWLPKTYYYRLVIFTNGTYGLFTQSQLPIVEAHQDIMSSDWKDYKGWADKDYPVMRNNGVEAGSKVENNKVWTSIEKANFRKTRKWHKFKKNIIYYNTNYNGMIKCEDCGKEIMPSFIEIHHLFPSDYDDLDRQKFKLLCHDCHEEYTKSGL